MCACHLHFAQVHRHDEVFLFVRAGPGEELAGSTGDNGNRGCPRVSPNGLALACLSYELPGKLSRTPRKRSPPGSIAPELHAASRST